MGSTLIHLPLYQKERPRLYNRGPTRETGERQTARSPYQRRAKSDKARNSQRETARESQSQARQQHGSGTPKALRDPAHAAKEGSQEGAQRGKKAQAPNNPMRL